MEEDLLVEKVLIFVYWRENKSKMMFDYEDIQKAKMIVLKIMDHPAASLFVSGNGEKSFNGLYHKLNSNSISSLHQFTQEISSVLSIVDQIYPGEYYAKTLSQYLKQLFQKEIEKAYLKSITFWSRRVASLERKIELLNQNNPIQQKYPKVEFIAEQKLASQLLSERDYSLFIKALNASKEQSDLEQLYKLVESMQPELTMSGAVLKIPIIKLKPATIKALIKKFKELFKERGTPFPS